MGCIGTIRRGIPGWDKGRYGAENRGCEGREQWWACRSSV